VVASGGSRGSHQSLSWVFVLVFDAGLFLALQPDLAILQFFF